MVADNGYHALNLVINDAQNLQITDHSMSEMDGYELCKRVREVSTLPIIMATSFDVGTEIPARATSAGANVVLSKFIDISLLLATIEELTAD